MELVVLRQGFAKRYGRRRRREGQGYARGRGAAALPLIFL
jgi:hypothetical protein